MEIKNKRIKKTSQGVATYASVLIAQYLKLSVR